MGGRPTRRTRQPVDASSGAFHNFREATGIEMLEIDLQDLINCADLAVAQTICHRMTAAR